MIKEYDISDILAAVNSISEIERKKNKVVDVKNEVFTPNNQVKSDNSEILVLDQMIELNINIFIERIE